MEIKILTILLIILYICLGAIVYFLSPMVLYMVYIPAVSFLCFLEIKNNLIK